jgi:hypothetical protein
VADDELGERETHEYDDTIPTPQDAAEDPAQDPDPADVDSAGDAPPAGEQPAADGAVDAEGVPLRADGTPARDKAEVD